MKVYVLSYDCDYGNWDIKGVYSTQELAEKARDEIIAKFNRVPNDHNHLEDFKIEEFEVQ